MPRYMCFFLEPTDRAFLALRRYANSQTRPCTNGSYHNGFTALGTAPVTINERGIYHLAEPHPDPPHDDARWPTMCARCGYTFQPDDEWQPWYERLYRRIDTGEEMTLRDTPPGALWYADWLQDLEGRWTGPDGRVLYCKTPGGDWNIDSRASNCGLKEDDAHRCWIRHGDPTDPQGLHTGVPLNVDKNGLTCQAGAGSIQCGAYHGFLRHGALED